MQIFVTNKISGATDLFNPATAISWVNSGVTLKQAAEAYSPSNLLRILNLADSGEPASDGMPGGEAA